MLFSYALFLPVYKCNKIRCLIKDSNEFLLEKSHLKVTFIP
jgi:hypothetical protein